MTPTTSTRSNSGVATQLYETEVWIRDGVEPRLQNLWRSIPPCDLVLKQHEAVERRFWPRRAAWNIDVARNDLVDARNGSVVIIETAARRTRTESQHPLRLGKL